MIITSKDNPLIKTAHALLTDPKKRKKLGQTVIEGTHLLDAYLKAGKMPITTIVSESGMTNTEIQSLLAKLNKNPIIISDTLYKAIRTLGESLPIMAIIEMPSLILNQAIENDCLIINGIQDTGNLGTLLRTASATGFETVICTTGTAHAYNPKTMRAGMGANFSLHIYENVGIDEIFDFVKVPMFATTSHADGLIYHKDLTKPLALIMGHEGQGVDKILLKECTPLTLPQYGQESLNVGVAGSVCLYEILRQRRFKNTHSIR
ncbi:TrmH family RNA methyltransferase [Moraxella bovis]|uniref:23S rRNA (Guanosine-2'-O-)-methyltransferase RlmB n=1 Tax=Moraxella bovis TaxID=476 RepID=A0A1T0A345_MORBO|nr:RNA methyltransferase [Moraxella bovis]OOR90018.1 RNA methyltransferase [Moraxella bovis]UYZ75372.1 RNA methyltransferase [Moraxella bovis]UYZ78695.1 RNA methyltransferase [Moraxella bovis]UYZ81661.1 RNA methyltransferase [Moraxella bovis]UYZ87177.1 RNA methyltransferase [Moraxella bovis]